MLRVRKGFRNFKKKGLIPLNYLKFSTQQITRLLLMKGCEDIKAQIPLIQIRKPIVHK